MSENNRNTKAAVINEEEEHRRRWLQYALQTPQPFPFPQRDEIKTEQEKSGETNRVI